MSLKNTTKKIKQYKNFYSDTNNSLSQTSKLRNFFTKQFNNLSITVVPEKTSLYQGTDFDFKENSHQDYFKYYDKRHNGAYFVSSYKIASLYGLNKDYSNIVYLTLPDNALIARPTNKYEYIYPLYYNPGVRGSNVKFSLNKSLYLIDIGNIENIKVLWEIIESLDIDKDTNEDYKDIIFNTCAIYDKTLGYKLPPKVARRQSREEYDEKLVDLFLNVFIPVLKQSQKTNIDGWIYYDDNDKKFHDEILIASNKPLEIKKITTLRHSIYNIPTREQFLKSIEHKKIKNDISVKPNTILSNYCIIKP